MTIKAGTKLGRYEIRSKIGESGMGEVYLAQDTKLDRKVVLKIWLPNQGISVACRVRTIWIRLNDSHPNHRRRRRAYRFCAGHSQHL